MSDKLFTLTLNSPITEEQWDMITDVDLDNTNEITFHTKHGKEVKFIKASAQPEQVCVANVTLTDEQVKEAVEKVKSAVISVIKPDRKIGKWQKLYGHVIPGRSPVWCCSECGKGIHVFGIEPDSYNENIADHQWLSCPNCDAKMIGEEE